STDTNSIHSNIIEGRVWISYAGAIVSYGVLVVVKPGRDVIRDPGVNSSNTTYTEIPGQLEDTGKTEPMPLIEVGPPALGPQVEVVRREREHARSVIDRVGESVVRQELQPAAEHCGSGSESEAVGMGAARGFELIDIHEIRIRALAGRGQRSVEIALAVQLQPAQHGVFRRKGSVAAQFPFHAQAGLEGVGSTDARV